ncbi:MAG: LLM class flavin-dependent oxidoreductase [Chloroflexi bacterium]|nr:LLM class flavin-dependent oxidoreductase [Chloroflexota bacterium]
MSISQTPQFGLVLSNRSVVTGQASVEDLLTLAQRAEEAGWDSVWVGDSIFAKPRLDALVLLAALAARTRRVRLGAASLTSVSLRNPLQLAYQWYSLDVLSQGRMIFNAGQGTSAAQGGAFVEEFAAFHIDPASRMRRMEEAIEILRLASSGEPVSYDGQYHQFREVRVLPSPAQQQMPIWISTATDPLKPKMAARALQRVARYADGWMTIDRSPELFAENLADIRRYAHDLGRELPTDFAACFYLNININNDEEEAFQESKRFLDSYYMYDLSPATVELQTVFGSPQTCIERLQQFLQAGATMFTLRPIGPDGQQQLKRITEEVLAAFT